MEFSLTKIACIWGVVNFGLITQEQAQAQSLEYEISSSYVSEYADRGATVSGQQIWSSISLSKGNFSAGAAYARTIGNDRDIYGDEIDVNFDYGFTISKLIGANIGMDIINDPTAGGLLNFGANEAATIEFYSGLSFDIPLQPTITTFYDVHLKDFTVEAAAEYGISIAQNTEILVGLVGGHAAIAQNDDNFYATGSIALEHSLTAQVTAFGIFSAGKSSKSTFFSARFINNGAPAVSAASSSVWAQVGISSQF